MHFQFDYFCSVATYDIIFGVVRYIIKHLFYEIASNDVKSEVKVHREYSPAARILHTKLIGLVTSFLWFQNSIDQAVLLNKC